MVDVLVWDTDTVELDVTDAQLLHPFHDRRAETSRERAFLDRDDTRRRLAVRRDQLIVDRLDEARVHDRHLDPFLRQDLRRLHRGPDFIADGEDHTGRALAHDLALSDRE